MSEEEVEKVLEELNNVRPEKLNDKAKRLFGAIMKIADERDNLKRALNEIREYISHEWNKREQIGVWDKDFQEWQVKDILEIINRVLGDRNG